jgi:hypothetical protein
VHQGGFVMFRHTKQELLNIEPFCHSKLNKIKNTNFGEIGVHSWYCWKAIHE